jgi:hypothetical protein
MIANYNNNALMQKMVAMQLMANKQTLIPKISKTAKYNKMNAETEHKKEMGQESHMSTQEYEKVFMYKKHDIEEEHLPASKVIEEYTHVLEEETNHIKDIKI